MLHGGAWRTGDKRNHGVWHNKVTHWGAQGYAFASVNTRLIPDAGPIDQARDLATAMFTIQKLAAQKSIDPEQIILMGHSAGAHVAALLAVRQDLQNQAGMRPWKATILLDTAALDVPAILQNDPARLYRQAFGSDQAYWAASSPSTHLDQQDGPFLIVCSSERRASSPAAKRFAQKSSANRITTTILPVQLGHAGINRHLGKPNGYTQAVDKWIKSLE